MNDAASASNVKEISIHDQIFSVPAPFSEGHVITAIEAKVLNQTRAENIANNFRKRVKAALDGVPLKEGEKPETMEAVAAALAAYADTYTFAMPSSGGREPVDPVEREALKIARAAIKDALTKAGKKIKDIDEDKLEAAIEAAAQKEEIVKEAKRRVNAQKKAAESTLAELGLES